MSRHELRIVILALVAIWAIALALWWSALWQAAVFFAISGADLPQLTTIVLRSAYAGGPFIVAAFLTAAALHLIWRPGPYVLDDNGLAETQRILHCSRERQCFSVW